MLHSFRGDRIYLRAQAATEADINAVGDDNDDDGQRQVVRGRQGEILVLKTGGDRFRQQQEQSTRGVVARGSGGA